MRAIAIGMLVAISLAGLPASGKPSETTAADLAHDPRLQLAPEVLVPGRAIYACLERASAATGVRLSADREAGDQKVVLVTRTARLGHSLDLLARHFGYRWAVVPAAAPGDPPAGYKLVSDAGRSAAVARSRDLAAKGRTRRLWERLDLRLRMLGAPPEALAPLRAQDPFIDSVGSFRPLQARLKLAALLRASDRTAVTEGRPFLSPPLGQLSPDIRALALGAGSIRDTGAEVSQLRYCIRRDTEDGADRLQWMLVGPDGRPVGHGGDLTFTDPPRHHASGPVVARASEARRKPNDPRLDVETELLDGDGRPLSITAGLPVLLVALSRATGFEVLSDNYSCQTSRYDIEPVGKRPLWQILNTLGEQYCLNWERRESFLRFRHREWFEMDLDEIPERQLDSWRTSRPVIEVVSTRDFIDAVLALTPRQQYALQFQIPGAFLEPPYAWEAFLYSLGEEQRRQLVNGQDLPGTELKPPAQKRLAALIPGASGGTLPASTLKAVWIRMKTAGSQLQGSLVFADAVQIYRSRLPLMQRPLPPVSIAEHSPRELQ